MKRSYIAAAVAAAVIALGGYFGSPYIAVLSLKSAAANHDRDKLEELVDFPAVRESLKAQMKAAMLKSFANDPEMQGNPFAGLALAMAPVMIDGMIDSFVTPDAMTTILRDGKPGKPSEASTNETVQPGSEPDYEQGFKDLNTFNVTVLPHAAPPSEKTTMVFKRQGLFDWRLKRIDLPLDDLPKSGG